jgi:GNAT superfamily N-acetyltransferase
VISVTRADGADRSEFCRLWNGIWPNIGRDVEELERDDALPERLRATRWLASISGLPVGYAEVYRPAGSYNEHKWSLEIGVDTGYRAQGIGSRLHDAAWEYLTTQGVVSTVTTAHEDDEHSIAFAAKRGFVEVQRDFESLLDVNSCDPELLDSMIARVPDEVKLVPIASIDSPVFRAQLHELFEEVRKDVPRLDPPVRLDFELFEEVSLGDPAFLCEASHVALVEGQPVGLSCLFQSAHPGRLDTWTTGVLREHRGKGIAFGLKAKTIKWAQRNGYQTARTDNNSLNATMLAINTRLGFRRSAAILTMRKETPLSY